MLTSFAPLLNLGHTLLVFAVVISVIVFVHEFGHYIVARWCGVKITDFSLGFGKELYGWHDKRGTRWKLCALPLGGYVKMYGDASAASNADVEALHAMPEAEKAQTFHFKSLPQKAAVVVAGPLANFLLAIVIYTAMMFTYGLQSSEPVVGEVLPNTPAAEAGIQAGDKVLRVNGKKMKSFSDIPVAIMLNVNHAVQLEIERGKEVLTLSLTPRLTEEVDDLGNTIKRPMIGIKSQIYTRKDVTLPQAVWEATKHTYTTASINLRALGQMITGQRSTEDLSGPIRMAKWSGQAAEKGLPVLLSMMALFSIGLGLINLMPVPMLDGGHLAFYAVEAVQGRPLAEKVQEWGYRVGFSLVAMLMALALFNDVRAVFFS